MPKNIWGSISCLTGIKHGELRHFLGSQKGKKKQEFYNNSTSKNINSKIRPYLKKYLLTTQKKIIEEDKPHGNLFNYLWWRYE